MKIVACFKGVPEEEDIVINPSHTLNSDNAEWKIGQYDLNAMELGALLAEETKGSFSILTIGNDVVENSKLKKSALSRGASILYAVYDEKLENTDNYETAKILAAAILKVEDVDLVLCGEGSGDIYAQEVGNMLGAILGWPSVNAVRAVSIKENIVQIERVLEDDIEVLEMNAPMVLSVTGDINRPRIPSMRDIMGAGKKPTKVWKLADLGIENKSGLASLELLSPEQTERKGIILEDASEESIETLYQHLRKLV